MKGRNTGRDESMSVFEDIKHIA
jgi:hypothetical protein